MNTQQQVLPPTNDSLFHHDLQMTDLENKISNMSKSVGWHIQTKFITPLQDQINSALNTVEEFRKQHQLLEADIEGLRRQNEGQKKQLSEVSRLQGIIDKLNATVKNQNKSAETMRNDFETLNETLTKKEKEIRRLKKKVKSLS